MFAWVQWNGMTNISSCTKCSCSKYFETEIGPSTAVVGPYACDDVVIVEVRIDVDYSDTMRVSDEDSGNEYYNCNYSLAYQSCW